MIFQKVKIGSICTLVNGIAFKSGDFQEEGIPVLKIANVKANNILLDNLQCVSEEIAEKKKKGRVYKGDILLTMTGNRKEGGPDSWVGKAALFRENGHYMLNQRLCIVRPDTSKVNTEYLAYYLSSWDAQLYFINHSTSSGGQANISPAIINDYEVALPSLEIQRKIAHVLTMMDLKIRANVAINRNLAEQAKALYKKMILDAADDSWQEGALSNVAAITMGQSPKGDTYNEDGSGEVFYQGRAEFGERFPTRRLFTTDPKRMAEENDVLMSVRAPVGDLNVAYEKCCIGRGLSAIHSKDGHQSYILYTMHFLRSALDQFNGEGTVFGSINKDALNKMSIAIPPKSVMDAFEQIVAPMDLAIKKNYEETCRLTTLRDSLLPKLMSGELDVTELDI